MNRFPRRSSTVTSFKTIIILLVLMALGYAPAIGELPKAVAWQLSDTKVVGRGSLATSAEGRLRTGIRVDGKAAAKAQDGTPAEGVFSVTMTAFTPHEDMPGQKKGHWYVSGNWTITVADSGQGAGASRRNPLVLNGVLKGSLPYDLTEEAGAMEADVRLQHRGVSPRGGRMSRGSFSGTSNLEGRLTIPHIPSSLPKGKETKD